MNSREERIARHEAAHAAFAIMLGVPVKCVALDAAGGYCEYSEDHSVTDRMLIILGALIEDAEVDEDYPEWPIDSEAGPDAQRADRRLLKRLADRIELDERLQALDDHRAEHVHPAGNSAAHYRRHRNAGLPHQHRR